MASTSQTKEPLWVTTDCKDEHGFPEFLHATLMFLGFQGCPRYVGREYEDFGTLACTVTVHIDISPNHPDIPPFSITAVGTRLPDTCQLAARNALRILCQTYEQPLGRSIMRYFPPADHSRPRWKARIADLLRSETCQHGPILGATATYLEMLDDLFDQQERRLEARILHEKECEARYSAMRLMLAEAEARAAKAESHSAAALATLVKFSSSCAPQGSAQPLETADAILSRLAQSSDPYQVLYQRYLKDPFSSSAPQE